MFNLFWIEDIGMEEIGWMIFFYLIFYEWVIIGIIGNIFIINIFIVDVIEEQYGGGEIYKVFVLGCIRQCGVENLRIWFYYVFDNFYDEDYVWIGVKFEWVIDFWVKNVIGQFLGYGIVLIISEFNFNIIQDCVCIDFRLEISGGWWYVFNIGDGLGNLFQCNYIMQGWYDFVIGFWVIGFNVFLDNYSIEIYSDIGLYYCWVIGLLFDNVWGGVICV